MTLWEYAIWGGFGGLAVELLQLYDAIRRTGDWPWRSPGEPRPAVLAFSVLIRVGLGVGLAVAAGDTNQVSGTLGAMAIGVTAPLLLQHMARQVPTPDRAPSEDRAASAPAPIAEEAGVNATD